ncbi:transposase family protein [Streptomyces sp. NPDC050400]|uniref:transposase family protein n=1 Tax=Streptomyces sp. NPDC050400 TaxID=3365610 RepID=UPI0037B3B3D1
MGTVARSVIVNRSPITGLTKHVIAELVAEIGPLWDAQRCRRLSGRPRQRAPGAGARYELVFVDRLLATLVHLRHGVTHDLLACWFSVDRSTMTRAIGAIRPLPARRGCVVGPGIRMRTLADVVDHLGASGQSAIIDATEIRVRRPAPGSDGRDRYISGKSKQNAVKVLVVTDAQGRLLFGGALKPGSCPDITQTGGQVITPPHRKFKKNAPTWWEERFAQQRKALSSRRIRVEHGIAHLKNWRALSRHLGRCELLTELVPAIAGLASIHRQPPQPDPAG